MQEEEKGRRQGGEKVRAVGDHFLGRDIDDPHEVQEGNDESEARTEESGSAAR